MSFGPDSLSKGLPLFESVGSSAILLPQCNGAVTDDVYDFRLRPNLESEVDADPENISKAATYASSFLKRLV